MNFALPDRDLIALLPRLRRYARVLTGDVSSADALIEATLESARVLRAPRPPKGETRAWLFQLVHDRYAGGVEKVFGSGASPGGPAVGDETPSASPGLAACGPSSLLVAGLDALAFEEREILLLVAVEGMSYREIAALLRLPTGTVMARLTRAREALRAAAAPSVASANVAQ